MEPTPLIPQVHDELTLAQACLLGNKAAQAELDRMVQEVARTSGVLRRLSPDQADELRSSILQYLLGTRDGPPGALSRYAGTGRLKAWLWTVIRREDARARRRRLQNTSIGDEIGVALDFASELTPELKLIRAECESAFRRAFDAALAQLTPRSRQTLRCLLHENLTLDEVASRMRVHRATIMRQLKKIQTGLLKITLLRLGQDLSLDRSQAESVLREALRSGAHIGVEVIDKELDKRPA